MAKKLIQQKLLFCLVHGFQNKVIPGQHSLYCSSEVGPYAVCIIKYQFKILPQGKNGWNEIAIFHNGMSPANLFPTG